MFNYINSNYKINNKFEIIADGYLANDGAHNDYLEKIDFYKKTDKSIIVFHINEISENSGIRFALKEQQNASQIFLNNILEFLCLPDYLLHKNNRVRTEYVSEVLNSRYIEISNAIIDQNFILLIHKYFNNLEEMHFNNCFIKSNCCFNKNHYQIVSFRECTFETMRCLNELDSYGLGFNKCIFNNISSTTLNVKRLDINGNEDDEYENIFLHCYFPNLDILHLRGFVDLNNSLMFLPHSCPNIFKLYVKANSIENISYLYNLTNLLECDIDTYDDYDDIKLKRDTLNYSEDDLAIYLNHKVPRMILKDDKSISDEYYFMYDDTKNSIIKEMLPINDKLYSWKNSSWIEQGQDDCGVRRKISPVICPKPCIIHPNGKVLFFSINPYNYQGGFEKVSEYKK